MGDIKRAHEHFMEHYGQQWNEIKSERDERERFEIERTRENERNFGREKLEVEVQEYKQQSRSNNEDGWGCCCSIQ